MKWLLILFSIFLSAHSAPISDFPFPLLLCASTTTITIGGTYTRTLTSTVTSATGTTTVTAPPTTSVTRTTTTIYSPTSISCIRSATTFAPYPAPLGTLVPRDPAPQAPTGCPTLPPLTIIPPTISNQPCTCITGDYAITTTTTTTTTTTLSTTTTTPTQLQTLTETWIQPTPTAYPGLNYYQYLNGYNYNNANLPGLGGGSYATTHWLGNYSFYTSGRTRNINFASPNWPTGAPTCQLPGQPSATDCSQWTVVFQGFLAAREPGTYTVHSPTSSESANWQDNSGFWWGGEKAYDSYSDVNVDGGASGAGISGVTNSVAYTLAAGEFMPFTFIYSNGQGPAANRVDVRGPAGRVYPQDLDLFVPPCADSPFVP
ncbi:GLEYA domain-containing protein [Aspergillus cavernicola]|uniref:GLEYA domain-containing protein n=1 Tax=Aspergillus cavernicola TaxID=176166 RepID=A0ABR4IER2_9EURO